jgi:3-oxoacyl-[acyl-carrier protein] reductase
MDLGLRDTVVLVTGSSSGAGQVTAALFGAEGARVVVDYHRDAAGARETAALVEQAGGQALVVQGDVTSRASMAALAATVTETWGPIQVLVNNAVSFESGAPLEELTDEKLTRMLDIVVRGAITATAACLPGMKAAGWGRIVNIASRSAIMGYEKMSHYAAAKSALVGLTRTWAKELGPAGILVNAIAPTVIMTPAMLEGMSEKAQENMAKRNPLGRLATPDDIARAILYLASGWNSYVNGEIITIGGGVMS